MANLAAFYETRNLFILSTSYIRPLTFEQWASAPDENKSALLFVQFYNPICTAWDKANAFDFIPGEDGVSIVLQYLEKNVSRILESPKKFTEAYIYRVAYNCMYCICHDLQSVKDRWENETPNIVEHDGEELNLYDTVLSGEGSLDDMLAKIQFNKAFWSAVEHSGPEAVKVINYLMTGDKSDLKKSRAKVSANDPLKDIEVSLDKVDSIVADLRNSLADLYAAHFQN